MVKTKRITFSNKHQNFPQIEELVSVLTEALNEYIPKRFFDYSPTKLVIKRYQIMEELDLISSFNMLSAIEAAFYIDYTNRYQRKLKDPLSRAFRDINKSKGEKVSFVEDILLTWKLYSNVPKEILGDLKGAVNFRNWLAHGRWKKPKFPIEMYDYETVRNLGQNVFSNFPFILEEQSNLKGL